MYYSVPSTAMWLVLAKYGEPNVAISVIKSLHDNTQAGITMDGNLDGLRQGVSSCTYFVHFILLM